MRYLIESGCPRGDEERLRELSAQNFYHDCYRYLSSQQIANNDTHDDNESFHAIYRLNSPVQVLQTLKTNGAVWDESASLAALYRDISFLQFVMLHGCPRTDDMTLRAAAMTRRDTTFLTKLQFLMEDMLLPLSNELFTIAVMYGSVSAVQYLVDVGCPCAFVSLPYRVKYISLSDISILESMEYATSHGCIVPDAFLYFVHNNQLPLCQATFPLPGKDLLADGIVDSVRDWDSIEAAAVCVAAARNQYLRLVYFVKSTLHLSHITFSLAIVHGSVECVFHLVDYKCPRVFELPIEFMMPNELDDTRISRCLEYALEHGTVRNEALEHFVFGNDLPLCQIWLNNN